MSEIYEGVKFTAIKELDKIIEHAYIKELKHWCEIFHKKDYAPLYNGGSSGNLSFRLPENPNLFIITAGFTALGENMSDEDFTLITSCNFEKNIVYYQGKRLPSSETILHYSIYKNRPDVNAIFHGHSPEILKNSSKNNVPTTKKEFAYGTKKLTNSVIEILGNQNFIIMKNHGFISMESNMEKAGNLIHIIHE